MELPAPAEREAWQPLSLSLSRPVHAGTLRVEVLRNVRQEESVHVDTSGRSFRYPRAVPLPYAAAGVHIGNGLFLDANGNVAFDIPALLATGTKTDTGVLRLRRESQGTDRVLEIAPTAETPRLTRAVLKSDTLIVAGSMEVRMPAREWPAVIEVVRVHRLGRDVVARAARTQNRIVVSRSDGSWATLTFIDLHSNGDGNPRRRLMIETSYGSTVYYEPI